MITSRDPTTGEVVLSAPEPTAETIAEAINRAHSVRTAWAARPLAERAALLRQIASALDRDRAELAALIVREVGKRYCDAEDEVSWTAQSARWYAEHPPRAQSSGTAIVGARPLGVIAAITPWNVPLISPAWKWLPALLAGNVVVWKPSELAPATAHAAAARLHEAGVPPDVLQVIAGGADAGRQLCSSPLVAGVHFTGSVAAGRAIASATAERFARCALEMGGLNIAVVFEDADLELAADCIIASGTALSGQKCTSTRRVLVAEEVAGQFEEYMVERIEALIVGDPRDPRTTHGPLVSPDARERAHAAVQRAVRSGARVVATAPPFANPVKGWNSFFPPTLLADLPDDDALATEELFAPVISIQPFADTTAAWRRASTSYGLAGSVFTKQPALVRQAASVMNVGVLSVNRRGDQVDIEAPFGGLKDSGNGFPEGGEYVYSGLTDLQAVYGTTPPEAHDKGEGISRLSTVTSSSKRQERRP